VTALRQFARKGLIIPPPRRWSGFVHLAFVVAVGLSLYFALTGNVSLACPQDATSCVKIDNWKVTGSHYYRQFPYDSAGNDDPGAPWVEISRQEYVADVGTLLRQDVLGGVIALCIAWPLAGIARHPEEEETGNRTSPLPDLTRPR